MKKVYLLSLIALLFVVACSKKDSGSNNNNDNNYYITADFNGVKTEFKVNPLADTSYSKELHFNAYLDSNKADWIWFDVEGVTAGTYKETDYNLSFGYVKRGAQAHLCLDDDAIVTITSKTSTSVQGTFSGTVVYQEREYTNNGVQWVTKNTVKITNGKFNVKIGKL